MSTRSEMSDVVRSRQCAPPSKCAPPRRRRSRCRAGLLLAVMALTLAMTLRPAGGANGEPEPAAKPNGVLDVVNGVLKVPVDMFWRVRDETEDATRVWRGAWGDLKTKIKETTGTEIDGTIDNNTRFLINGVGQGHMRNLFWWNMTAKQNLWKDAELVARVRGCTDGTGGEPSHGIYHFITPKQNLDWHWGETECLYLANVVLKQRLLDKKLLIAVGKINEVIYFDTNNVAGFDFLSFHLARNASFPHRPHTIGSVVRYDVADWLYVQAGLIDDEGIRSEMGTNTAFHGECRWQSMYEAGVKTKIGGREGNYRVDVWHDPTPLARHDGTGSERDNVGFGMSFDQMITDQLGLFFRYGFNHGDVHTFCSTWSVGGTYSGLIPGREKDVLGIGFAQGITSGEYQSANNATPSESLFEAYYKLWVNDWISVYPDVQVLLNPGTRDEDVVVVGGLRVKLSF